MKYGTSQSTLLVAAALVAWFAASCIAGQPIYVLPEFGMEFQRPPRLLEGEYSRVRAADLAWAAHVQGKTEAINPEVARAVGCAPIVPEVWLLEQSELGYGDGAFFSADNIDFDVILLTPQCLLRLDYTLAHELAHWYSMTALVDLPAMVEEGFCELVACEVVPSNAEVVNRNYERFLGAAPRPSVAEALRLSQGEVSKLTDELALCVRALGFEVAKAHGLSGLIKLREQAALEGRSAVPIDWLLAPSDVQERVRELDAERTGGLAAPEGRAAGDPPS